MEFAVGTTEQAGATVVAVRGEVDLYTAPELKSALLAAAESGAERVLVDLRETTFIDSTALGVLVGAKQRIASRGGRIDVVCNDRNVAKIFEITGLDRVFRIYATLEEAAGGESEGSLVGSG
jgi:anti-sigma B factor antagonist